MSSGPMSGGSTSSGPLSSGPLMIPVAGPYRSGTDGDAARIQANVNAMTATALALHQGSGGVTRFTPTPHARWTRTAMAEDRAVRQMARPTCRTAAGRRIPAPGPALRRRTARYARTQGIAPE